MLPLRRFTRGEILSADKLNELVETVNALAQEINRAKISVGPGLLSTSSPSGTTIALAHRGHAAPQAAAATSDFPFKTSATAGEEGLSVSVAAGMVYVTRLHFAENPAAYWQISSIRVAKATLAAQANTEHIVCLHIFRDEDGINHRAELVIDPDGSFNLDGSGNQTVDDEFTGFYISVASISTKGVVTQCLRSDFSCTYVSPDEIGSVMSRLSSSGSDD